MKRTTTPDYRPRPPPKITWRRVLNMDAAGAAVIAIFFVTLILLAGFFLVASHHLA